MAARRLCSNQQRDGIIYWLSSDLPLLKVCQPFEQEIKINCVRRIKIVLVPMG